MKKYLAWISILLIAVMMLSLVSCRKKFHFEDGESTPETSTEEIAGTQAESEGNQGGETTQGGEETQETEGNPGNDSIIGGVGGTTTQPPAETLPSGIPENDQYPGWGSVIPA